MPVQKILVPIVPAQTPRPVLRQAAFLARLHRAEIILLHVVPPRSETLAAQDELDRAPLPELDGLAVSRLACPGDPARQIVRIAREQRADLIMLMLDPRWRAGLGWRGPRVFQRLLLRSVAARVIEEAPCSVWAVRDDAPEGDFRMRRVLCFLDLGTNNGAALARAADIAAAADAALFLFHAIPGTDIWVPGGSRFSHLWKEIFTDKAVRAIARLQNQAGTQAEVLIESGAGPPMLIAALEKIQADLLVAGHFTPQRPSEDYADIYAILRNAPVPVLISKNTAHMAPGAEAQTGAATSNRRRVQITLAILGLVILLGLGLLEVAFYTTLHPTGLCSSDHPNCDFSVKPGATPMGN